MNSKGFPLVSILIPCHDAEKWIDQSIQSALDQTYFNKEIIVIDDGSTDRSLDYAEKFSSQIRLEYQSHQGANATRNKLLLMAGGEWVQYLDADDFLFPNKVADQIAHLSQIGVADVVYSPVIVEELNLHHKLLRSYVLHMPSSDDINLNYAHWGCLQTTGFLWKKEAIESVSGWCANQPACQEHELILRLIQAKKLFSFFNKANSIYRRQSSSSVSTKNIFLTTKCRMSITGRFEDYLFETGNLTHERLHMINQSRFDCSRSVYSQNRKYAKSLISQIYESDHFFEPSGPAAPGMYSIFYKYFGFDIAEGLATVSRQVMRWVKSGNYI